MDCSEGCSTAAVMYGVPGVRVLAAQRQPDALSDRVRGLLADWQARTGRLAAVTHAPLIKTAVVQALHAPVQAVWDLDVAPGSTTELHSTPSGWRVTAVSCRQAAPKA